MKLRYPTGLGALIVRNSSASVLQKKYFGGGTVALALWNQNVHRLRDTISERFEDGTISYLSILALRHCFQFLKTLGGVEAIDRHTHSLAQHLFERLASLRHYNGSPVCVIAGNHQLNDPSRLNCGIFLISNASDKDQ